MLWYIEAPSMQKIILNYHRDLISLTVHCFFQMLIKVQSGKNNAGAEKKEFSCFHVHLYREQGGGKLNTQDLHLM